MNFFKINADSSKDGMICSIKLRNILTQLLQWNYHRVTKSPKKKHSLGKVHYLMSGSTFSVVKFIEGFFSNSAYIKTLLPVETQRLNIMSTEFLWLMQKVVKSPRGFFYFGYFRILFEILNGALYCSIDSDLPNCNSCNGRPEHRFGSTTARKVGKAWILDYKFLSFLIKF